MSTPKPTDEGRVALSCLVRHGFRQGERNGSQWGNCVGCDKTVTRNRTWWLLASSVYDDWECYCKKCALEKVHTDTSMWDAIPLPNRVVSANSVEVLTPETARKDKFGS